MKLVKYEPRSRLRECIEILWLRDNSVPAHDAEREAILPDGRAHLVINLSEDAVRIFPKIEHDAIATLSGSVFCGPQSVPYAIFPTASVVMGVHFRAGGAFPFLPMPAEEFRNAHVPLEDVYGASAYDLRLRLLRAPSAAQKFAILEGFLLRQMAPSVVLHRAVGHAVRAFATREFATIADVLSETGLSERRFSHVFSEQVGLTPKLFQRVQRFQLALAKFPRATKIDWAQTAVAAGYYDQAHFIHEFRAFCSVTPRVYHAARIEQPNHLSLAG